VLLQQRAAGLQWLAERWEQVTDPASRDYRDFVPRSEILRRLSPPPPAQRAVQRWVHARGWEVLQRYGDAMLVVCCRPTAGSSPAAAAQLLRSDDPAAPKEVVAVVATSNYDTNFLHLSPRPRRVAATEKQSAFGVSAATLRELYSLPQPVTDSGGKDIGQQQQEHLVANWQGGNCKVFPPDVQEFCTASGLDSAQCASHLNVSVPGPAPNSKLGCIEAELDTEMVLAVNSDSLHSLVGVNNGTSFLAWALSWFQTPPGPGVPEIATVSWGGGEGQGVGSPPSVDSTQMRLNTEFQKLGVLGRAIFWASGDAGTGAAARQGPVRRPLRPFWRPF
jgi:hypothetical protein